MQICRANSRLGGCRARERDLPVEGGNARIVPKGVHSDERRKLGLAEGLLSDEQKKLRRKRRERAVAKVRVDGWGDWRCEGDGHGRAEAG